MGDSLENQDVSVDTQNAAVVDYGAFANYLRKAATILLPEDDVHIVPPALNIALEDRSNQDAIKKFLSDSQVQALYIQRTSTKGKLYLCHSLRKSANCFFLIRMTSSCQAFFLMS